MNRRVATLLLAAAAAWGVLSCALVAVRQPASGGDYVAIWGLKARALQRTGSLAALVRPDPTALASHPEYPPLWPAILALFSGALGRYDDLFVTLLWPLLCAGAALLAARATRAEAPFAALAAAVVALLPFWREPLTVGYADGLLLVLLLGAAVAAKDARRDALLVLLFLLAALTKQEGALAALAAAAVLAIARRFRGALLALGGAALGVVSWALWVRAHLPAPPARDFALAGFDAGRVGAALRALAREAGTPGLAWLAGGALLALLGRGALRRNRGLVAAALLYSGALVLLFGFSVRDVAWHVRWTWDRLALVPVAILVPLLAEASAEASAEALSGEA